MIDNLLHKIRKHEHEIENIFRKYGISKDNVNFCPARCIFKVPFEYQEIVFDIEADINDLMGYVDGSSYVMVTAQSPSFVA